MDPILLLNLVLLVLLIALTAVFVGSEFAVVKIRMSRLDQLIAEGNKKAVMAKKVASDYEAAKAEIAHAIGAKGNDLVITAGATEANNLAFTALSLDGSCRRSFPHRARFAPRGGGPAAPPVYAISGDRT